VISEVFPTLWSPRSTILLRFNGGDEKSAVAGVAEEDMVVQTFERSKRDYSKMSESSASDLSQPISLRTNQLDEMILWGYKYKMAQ
jgi:hypothetical protein